MDMPRQRLIFHFLSIIKANWTAQYLKQPQSEADVYGVPFSYESIMLYDKTSPKGGDPQIMYALVPGMDDVMGQRSHLADTDIQLINAMYGCQPAE